MKAGDTFHVRSPSSTKSHLYIVVTGVDAKGNLVIANVTTQDQGKDQSCVLNVGDHPFLTRESVVNYAEALIAKEENVLSGARGGVVQHDVPVPHDVLNRVQQGAIASPHTEIRVKNAVKAALDK